MFPPLVRSPLGLTGQDTIFEEDSMAEAAKIAAADQPSKTVEGRPLEVTVDERGLERAIRRLKRKIATEGVTRELKRRRHYEKPSVRKRRKAREAERRRRRRERRAARRN